MIDLEMMVTFGGKERIEQEFATLLSGAGLTWSRSRPSTAASSLWSKRRPLEDPIGDSMQAFQEGGLSCQKVHFL
jgi:hypothetical protein